MEQKESKAGVTTPPNETAKQPSLKPVASQDTVNKHVEGLKAYLKGFIGKRFMNPNFGLKRIAILEDLLASKDYTAEQKEAAQLELLAMKQELPIAPGMKAMYEASLKTEANAQLITK